VLVLAAALACAGAVRAQEAPPAVPPGHGSAARGPGAPKLAHAMRVAGPPPRIDGRLDDPAWSQARFFADLVEKEPIEGAAPSVRTEVGFLYDAEALYVGLRMYGPPATILAPVTRRDNGGDAEHVWISLDTYGDHRTAYSFAVTASGARMDAYHPKDTEMSRDASWDPVWEAKARIDSTGWTAEMRIPFSQLRFNDAPEQVWGLNVDRWRPSGNEDIYWIPVPHDATGWSSRMGLLVGIAGVRPPRRIEVSPYAAGDATARGTRDAADPFTHAVDTEARLGGDFKMGLGPNVTVDGTVNPDFGQVEADPAVVNLSAFETFFAERRPFFTEGSQLLQGDGPGYFYSRRIGAKPRYQASGDYVDQPNATTILGATKLSGRLASGFALGGLVAVTAREYARTYDSSFSALDSLGRPMAVPASRGSVAVAPLTVYGVLRGRQEFGRWASTAGFILTAVRRDVSSGDALGSLLAREAYSGGGDFTLRLNRGMYEVGGWAGFSYVAGDTGAIARVQTSSAHYFQRPGAGYVRYDSTRTSLPGYTANLRVSRVAGRHWLWDVAGTAESPGLELNDVGQIQTADGLSASGSLRYREVVPGRVFRGYTIGVSSGGEWNYGGDPQYGNAHLALQATLRNWWSPRFDFDWRFRTQDERLTRGGPTMGRPQGWSASASLGNNFAAPTRVSAGVSGGRDELGGWSAALSASLSMRPSPRIQLSLSPGYSRGVDRRQYLTVIDTGGPAATGGARYVFAAIERSTLSAQLRVSYTFTPDLTLEAYAEPFAASGRYFDHGELSAPRSLELTPYALVTGPSADSALAAGTLLARAGTATLGLPAADFNVRSFRSNLVLRWEWRPGSTLFLVWQQNRYARSSSGGLVRPGSIWDAFSATGDNFFAVKFSYWVPVG
jgi:hypothetical protein